MSRIAISGGRKLGNRACVLLAHSRRKHEIRIWARETSVVQSMQENRENATYLPGIQIPASVFASNDLAEVLRDAQIVIGVMPSAHARSVYLKAVPYLSAETAIVSATKGLEPATHLRMSEVIEQVFALQFIPRHRGTFRSFVCIGGSTRRSHGGGISFAGSRAGGFSPGGIRRLRPSAYTRTRT